MSGSMLLLYLNATLPTITNCLIWCYNLRPLLKVLSRLSDLPNTLRLLSMSIYPLDLALHPPLTLAAVFLLHLSHYAHAVLTILPNTFFFRLFLGPFILWQAWRCAVGFDFGAFLGPLLGHQGIDRFAFWNYFFVVSFSQRRFPLVGHMLKLWV